MSFVEAVFLPFLLAVSALYYLTPKKYRYLVLLAASYIFYGFHDHKLIIILGIVTGLTYLGGLILEKRNTRGVFAFFFVLNLAVLFVMKYLDFTIKWLDFIASRAGSSFFTGRSLNIAAPIGLSFYIFQSTTYLSDIYRKGLKAERNPFRYAAFVSFFPVILSGPIQKARNLLPQLKNPASFSAESFIRAFMLFLWGYFEKIVVSNKLNLVVDACWEGDAAPTGIYSVIAAVVFSLYIYCDFSAYSDMACGISRMLGFSVQNNFHNPYLATSLAGFWNRWHITLNEWFIENVYIPLGGNRKGTVRKYINVMIVFLFSGAWHGAAVHFIAWGGVNGLLQIIGQILAPIKEKMYSMLKIDENCFSIRFLKRAGVFSCITLTWVFFRAPGTRAAIGALKNIFTIRMIDFFNPDVFSICGTVPQTFFCILVTAVFLIVQVQRKETSKYYLAFRRQPIFFQTLFAGFMMFVIIMASVSGNADINTQFIYFQF